jgi:hypothetical protein
MSRGAGMCKGPEAGLCDEASVASEERGTERVAEDGQRGKQL